MSKVKTIVVAALAALAIPVSLPAEQMRIEKRISQMPDMQFYFGVNPRKVYEAILRYIGDGDARFEVKTAHPDKTDRPRRFVRTEETKYADDWRCTSWWVEEKFERDDVLSEGTNVCGFCEKRFSSKRFVQPALEFHKLGNLHDSLKRAGENCGTVYKAVPLRFARIRVGTTTTTYTDARDGSVALKTRNMRIDVIDVVSPDEFYGRYCEEENARLEMFKRWVKEKMEEKKEAAKE